MLKRVAPILALLMAAGVAHAQLGGGGGGMGGGGGGHRGGGRGGGPPSGDARPATSSGPKRAATPVNQLQFVGVVKSIDANAGRITIAYEPVEAIDWPAGTQPFPVAKTALLSVAKIGQKVRFNLDSGHISALAPFDVPQ